MIRVPYVDLEAQYQGIAAEINDAIHGMPKWDL
jgi:hypothetical protein